MNFNVDILKKFYFKHHCPWLSHSRCTAFMEAAQKKQPPDSCQNLWHVIISKTGSSRSWFTISRNGMRNRNFSRRRSSSRLHRKQTHVTQGEAKKNDLKFFGITSHRGPPSVVIKIRINDLRSVAGGRGRSRRPWSILEKQKGKMRVYK